MRTRVLPYKKTIKMGNGLMAYDPEDVFRDIIAASKGSDADLSGMLEVEKADGISPYEQLRRLRGVQWPAPTAKIARKGGTPATLSRPGRLGGQALRRV